MFFVSVLNNSNFHAQKPIKKIITRKPTFQGHSDSTVKINRITMRYVLVCIMITCILICIIMTLLVVSLSASLIVQFCIFNLAGHLNSRIITQLTLTVVTG